MRAKEAHKQLGQKIVKFLTENLHDFKEDWSKKLDEFGQKEMAGF